MNISIQNPFTIFETHLKNIHKLLSMNEVSQDNLPMVKDTFWELLKSYQALKNETARMEKSKKRWNR